MIPYQIWPLSARVRFYLALIIFFPTIPDEAFSPWNMNPHKIAVKKGQLYALTGRVKV